MGCVGVSGRQTASGDSAGRSQSGRTLYGMPRDPGCDGGSVLFHYGESCHHPFMRADGSPYLEPHSIRRSRFAETVRLWRILGSIGKCPRTTIAHRILTAPLYGAFVWRKCAVWIVRTVPLSSIMSSDSLAVHRGAAPALRGRESEPNRLNQGSPGPHHDPFRRRHEGTGPLVPDR